MSRQPGLMHDPEWQARSKASIDTMLVAANGMRIEPVPETLQSVDNMLGRAQTEAQAAADSYSAAIQSSNAAELVSVLQRVDRMSVLIQQAYALLRG